MKQLKFTKAGKANNKPTDVSKLIERKAPKLAKGIQATLDIWRKKLAKRLKQSYEKHVVQKGASFIKADSMSDDDIVKKILDSIDLEGFSVDLIDEITPDLIMAFKDAGIYSATQVGVDSSTNIVKHMDTAARDYAEERAGELIKDFAETNADYIRSIVAIAVSEGRSADDLADDIESAGAFGEARSTMIARTELAFAHTNGNIEGWKESGQVDQKEWYTAPDCCPDCDEINGEIVGIDEDFSTGDYGPPLHPNCFLGDTEVAAFCISTQFKRWFHGEICVITVQGKDTFVTPNHPILTNAGWIKAGELNVGDSVYHAIDPIAALRSVRPDNDHMITRIEEVASSLLMSGGVPSNGVPTSTENFHGDGIANGKVDIVFSTSLLKSYFKPIIDKGLARGALSIRQWSSCMLHGDSSSTQFIERDRAPLDGSMSVFDKACALNLRGLGHSIAHGLGSGANVKSVANKGFSNGFAVASKFFGNLHAGFARKIALIKSWNHIFRKTAPCSINVAVSSKLHSSLSQNSGHNFISDASFGGNCLDRFAGFVALAPISNLRRVKFKGHVYNLSTDEEWYFANGIIAHNCRCTVLPVLNDGSTNEDNLDEGD